MSKHPIGLGSGGAGSVTSSGTLTNNAAVFGAGTTVVKTDNSITTDGSGNLTAVSFTASGTGAAYTQWTTSAFAVGAAGTVRCGAFTGDIFACSDAGGAVTALPFIAGDIGGTQASPQITAAHFTGDAAFGTTFGSITVPNAGSTGTTVNLLAKLDGSANAVLPTTGNTGLPMAGIVTSGAGTAGSAHIAVVGTASCIADNVVTTGDAIGVGTTTAGRCKSLAAAGTAPAAGLTVIGVAMGSAAAAGSFNVWLTPEAAYPAAVSSVFTRTGAVVAASGDYTLDQIGNPAAAKNWSLSNANDLTMTMGAATTSASGLTITDTATNGSATGYLLNLNSSVGSTIKPLIATALGTANGATVDASGNLTMIGTGLFKAINGSAATPSYSFTAGSLGMYESGGNQINFGISSANQLAITNGNVAAPAFSIPIASTLFSVNSSGLPTKSNNVTLAGQGYPLIQCITSQKSETAADASLLSCTPASAIGTYKITFVHSVQTATSAIVGWTATWTDSGGVAQAPTNLSLFQVGTAAPALTFTAASSSAYYGTAFVDVNNAGTAIVVKTTLGTGTLTTSKASAVIERVI